MTNYLPQSLQAKYDAILTDVEKECAWAESHAEELEIIAKGQAKVNALYDFTSEQLH